MARIHGKNVNYKYNTIDIEDELNAASISFTIPPADITTFADAWQNFLAGKKNVKTDISGTLDMTLAKGEATLFASFGGGPVTTLLDFTGSGAGANTPTYETAASGLTGTYLESLNISVPVGGTATYSATLQHSGATTRETS